MSLGLGVLVCEFGGVGGCGCECECECECVRGADDA